MSKQFWIFLVVGLGVVGVLISTVFMTTKGSHLELQGEILKVRVLSLNPNACIVVADFRVTNPSDIPFVVKEAQLFLQPSSGDEIDGTRISKADVENVFKYEKLLGTKYNDVLSIRDRIEPHKTVDRMVAARIDEPEAAINARKMLRLHVEELDGVMADLLEKK